MRRLSGQDEFLRAATPDTATHARATAQAKPVWRDALRRGAILGTVVTSHLAFLTLVLHPSWQQLRSTDRRNNTDALRITFRSFPGKPTILPVSARWRTRLKAEPAPSAGVAHRHVMPPVSQDTTATRTTRTDVTMPPLPSADTEAYHGYRPGDFQAAMQSAQQPPAARLPGSDSIRSGSIRIRVAPSIKETVGALTTAARCASEEIKMRKSTTQFITAQLMDRALEADGCGPQASHLAADATIDAISHREIFSN